MVPQTSHNRAILQHRMYGGGREEAAIVALTPEVSAKCEAAPKDGLLAVYRPLAKSDTTS